jgi:hypothetical protein
MCGVQQERIKRYMGDQIKEIEEHRWIESEKAGCCVALKATEQWLREYASTFRSKWEKENGPVIIS